MDQPEPASDEDVFGFQQLDMDSSWVQTCENSSLVPVYNVSVRAALRTPAAVFTGPWSEVFSLQPTCQPAVEYWKIILMVVGASLAFLIVIGGLIHSIRYAKKQKDYFKDLGMVSIRQHSVRKIFITILLFSGAREQIHPHHEGGHQQE